jgi:hypothetical protein
MSARRPKWGQIERFFLRQGFEIRSRGGERILISPAAWQRGMGPGHLVRIGHTSCRSHGTEVLHCYVRQIRRVFGVTPEEIAEG